MTSPTEQANPVSVASCRAVTRWYTRPGQDERAIGIEGIDLEVASGELLVLMGPSGCGKTTLLNLLGLLDRPTEGEVHFEGRPTAALSDDDRSRLRRLRIGHVFQFFHLLPHLTLLQNVEMPMILDGRSPREFRDRARELLGRVGLAGRENDLPPRLSGGEQQRVALARAVIADPALVLADEPTGSLDTHRGKEILDLLHELVVARGRAVVMATHSEEAARHGTRLVRLRDGRIDAPAGGSA